MGTQTTLFLLATLSVSLTLAQNNFVCYFGSWATYRPGDGKFDVANIDPFLCTHLIFGFAGVNEVTHEIKILDPYYEDCSVPWEKCAYGNFTNLENINPNLKTLIAVGGWTEGATRYTAMSSTFANRKKFIDSSLDLVIRFGYSGLDMDWEYPGGRADSPGDEVNDPTNFVLLLQEMRAAFDQAFDEGRVSERLLITAAVSAGWQTIDRGYLIPQVSDALDLINVMTYDYHGWFGGVYPYTGHNSPMYALDQELDPEHEFFGWNANYSIQYWIDGGADPLKLLLGIGTYGRGFVLSNANENGVYAPASGPNPAGPYTREAGFQGYNEWCEIKDSYTVIKDPQLVSPYAYDGTDWFSFEDPETAAYKAQWALDKGLGGAFIWSVETDDFLGKCGEGINPIQNAIANVITNGPATVPDGYTTEEYVAPTTDDVGDDPEPNAICTDGAGNYPNPLDCSKYYICQNDGNGGWTVTDGSCPPGLVYNPINYNCDWEDNADTSGCGPDAVTDAPPTTAAPEETTEKPADCSPNAGAVCPFAGEGARFDDLCDCQTYYTCVSDGGGGYALQPWTCGSGTAFDAGSSTCVDADQVNGCSGSRQV